MAACAIWTVAFSRMAEEITFLLVDANFAGEKVRNANDGSDSPILCELGLAVYQMLAGVDQGLRTLSLNFRRCIATLHKAACNWNLPVPITLGGRYVCREMALEAIGPLFKGAQAARHSAKFFLAED